MLIRPYALKKDAQANICNKARSIQQKNLSIKNLCQMNQKGEEAVDYNDWEIEWW